MSPELILGVIIGIPFAIAIYAMLQLFRCPHVWHIAERGSVYYPGTNIKEGRYLIKECGVCHKMKTERS